MKITGPVDLRNSIIAYLVERLGGSVEIPREALEDMPLNGELFIDQCFITQSMKLRVKSGLDVKLAISTEYVEEH